MDPVARFSHMLAVAPSTLDNLLVALVLSQSPKTVNGILITLDERLREALPQETYKSVSFTGQGVQRHLDHLRHLGVVRREKGGRASKYVLTQMGESQVDALAPFHLQGISQFGTWLGDHTLNPAPDGPYHVRFLLIELLNSQTPIPTKELAARVGRSGRYVGTQLHYLERLGFVETEIVGVSGERYVPITLRAKLTPQGEALRETWVVPYREFYEGRGDGGPVAVALRNFRENPAPVVQTVSQNGLYDGSFQRRTSHEEAVRAMTLFLQEHPGAAPGDVREGLGWNKDRVYLWGRTLVKEGIARRDAEGNYFLNGQH